MGVAAAVAASAVVGAVATNVAANKASSATDRASRNAISATGSAATQAREDINRIFPQAQATANLGNQAALDVFGSSVPAQMRAFQQGNVSAQQAVLAGLPQIQNAILGGNVDLSGLQPFRANIPDSSMFQQRIPNFNEQQQAAPFIGPLVATPNSPWLDSGVDQAGAGGLDSSLFIRQGLNNGL